jgi:hypothetical protein
MRSSLLWQKDSNPKSANDARLLQIATSKNPHGLPWGVVSRNSIEDRILELQKKKKDLADQILNGEALSSSVIIREDLMQILS